MGLLFSRVGSDPYYASYERSFEKVEKEIVRLQTQKRRRQQWLEAFKSRALVVFLAIFVPAAAIAAQVHRQPPGTFTAREHFIRVSPVLLVPVAFGIFYFLAQYLCSWKDAAQSKKTQRLVDIKRKLIKELRDSTRYDKTHQLIKKYDPDATPASVLRPKPGGWDALVPPVRGVANGTSLNAATSAAGAAAGAMGGVSKALFPVIEKLASSMIGDNPVVLEQFRQVQHQLEDAQQQASALWAENVELREEVQRLRQQLGELPDSAATADSTELHVSGADRGEPALPESTAHRASSVKHD